MNLNFKTWMLIENPDTVIIKPNNLSLEKETLNWRSGRTFCLFDSYYLISIKGVAVIHESIAHRINECHLAIQAALRNEIAPQELSDCLTSPSRRDGSNFLESKGTISKKTLDQLSKTVQMSQIVQDNLKNLNNKDPGKKREYSSYRSLSLNNTPEVILGRIWTNEKIISFWNPTETIFNQSQNILEFISELDQPKEYQYEIQNIMLSYEDFIQKKMLNKHPEFDTSIIHTMIPGEAKTQLQKSMGMKFGSQSPRNIDIRNKQLAYTSENRNNLS